MLYRKDIIFQPCNKYNFHIHRKHVCYSLWHYVCICNLVTLTAGHQIRKKKKKDVRILTKNIYKSLFHLIETVGNSPKILYFKWNCCCCYQWIFHSIIESLIIVVFFSKHYWKERLGSILNFSQSILVFLSDFEIFCILHVI